MNIRPLLLGMLFVPALAIVASSAAAAAEAPDYVRFREDSRTARLEVAIKSFTLPSGQTVDLVGVVHIADQAYYQSLNQRFTGYDSVLFELVGNPEAVTGPAPAANAAPATRGTGSGVSTLQESAARYLKLSFQLDAIDYTVKNMVHADATRQQFAKMQAESGESMLSLFARAMQTQMSGKMDNTAMNELDTFGLIRILMSEDSAAEFKKSLAKIIDQSEAMTALMEAEGKSVIVSGRNELALNKAREVLANRKQRRIAVFYGAAHMPGIETSLIQDLKARPAGEEWLAAWTMPKKPKTVTTPPADKTPAP